MTGFHLDKSLCNGVSDLTAGETYEGQFGRWSVTSEDVSEVYGYRAGLTIAAAGMGSLLLHTCLQRDHCGRLLGFDEQLNTCCRQPVVATTLREH